MKNRLFKGLLVTIALVVHLPAAAADIDLFAGNGTVGTPSVMFVLDNAANFSASVATQHCSITAGGVVTTDGTGTAPTNLDGTAGAVEQCALYAALSALDVSSTAKFNMGVMGFNATGMKQYDPVSNTFSSGCVGGTGGCLMMALSPLNSDTKPRILDWIRKWATSGNSDYVIKGNNTANGAAMQETWAYYYGKTGVSGRNYAGMLSLGCGNKYIIFVGNAYRNNATPGDGTNEANSPLKPFNGTSIDANKRANPATTAAQQADITGTIITSCGTGILSTAEGDGAYALKWARYLKAQGTRTYSIGVLGPTCNAIYAAHLTTLGSDAVGGARFFGTNNFNDLKVAFQSAISEIQAKNSAFASVSLPVSVNTQGTYLNQVYIGMFRPAASFAPRWPGNLKQYKMGKVGNALQLLDADGGTAIATDASGFIYQCARSYWTPKTDDTYWGTEFTDANCSPHAASSNTPDGNIVEKGAQGYMLRAVTPAARVVKACGGSCGTTLSNFDTSNSAISKTALGDSSMSDAARTDLINWARGLNNMGDEIITDATVMRPSVHGDVVHSRPVAINFGTDAAPQVAVFYGANDGMLHAINGNREGGLNVASQAPGAELWSFMPTEFYGKLSRLRSNAPAIYYPGTPVGTATAKDYGFDGPISAYKSASNSYIFASMRRGGRAVYAFDVTSPGVPTLLWKKSSADSDYAGLGQTWSTLKVVKAAGYNSGASPLLVMGGGYDTCEDADPNTCTSASLGRHIYVMDAVDGTMKRTFDTVRGVIGDVTIVPDSTTGLIKYAYAADLGGNIYRISGANANSPIGTTAPGSWTMTKIASLGCDTIATCTANRKFMFGPDVIEDSGIYYLALGSGDREKPLKSYTSAAGVANLFFMVKDQPSSTTWLSSESTTCGASIICKNSLTALSTNPSQSTLDASKGWYLDLRSQEQVVTSVITLYGVSTFSTHIPSQSAPNSCESSLGVASVYNIHYLDGSIANGTDQRFETIAGGGLPPSPVAGLVTLDSTTTTQADGTTTTVPGQTVPFIIGASGSSPLQTKEDNGGTSSVVFQPKVRAYWYIQQ